MYGYEGGDHLRTGYGRGLMGYEVGHLTIPSPEFGNDQEGTEVMDPAPTADIPGVDKRPELPAGEENVLFVEIAVDHIAPW